MTRTPIRWYWLGRAQYRRVWADQLALRERVWAGDDGAVLLCEHPPVITLGRSATAANILAAGDVPIERVERGGEVTYHGPGQLMIYPVVRIPGVVPFLATVAAAIAQACAALGVRGAAWQQKPAGVWCGDRKLAACGIHVARDVSVHGFALDVATPAAAWAKIRACGLDAPHASLAGELGRAIEVTTAAIEVGPRVAAALTAMR
ncbi:MAG TPA: lipoyl(octanoyl) transferase LipB [Kofleriaceae bacterium]|nr:lipoyl(octanoyl) transferase LipB [Kofleriaceae bacterium]